MKVSELGYTDFELSLYDSHIRHNIENLGIRKDVLEALGVAPTFRLDDRLELEFAASLALIEADGIRDVLEKYPALSVDPNNPIAIFPNNPMEYYWWVCHLASDDARDSDMEMLEYIRDRNQGKLFRGWEYPPE